MTKYLALGFYRLYAGARYSGSGTTQCCKAELPFRIYRVSRLLPSWAAGQTFGNYVFLRDDAEESLLRHELVHVCQFARHAPFFPLLYLLASIRHGYKANPYEVEAYEEDIHGREEINGN